MNAVFPLWLLCNHYSWKVLDYKCKDIVQELSQISYKENIFNIYLFQLIAKNKQKSAVIILFKMKLNNICYQLKIYFTLSAQKSFSIKQVFKTFTIHNK
jgi:hypothetical protein